MFPLKDDNPTSGWPYVTIILIAINLIVMLWMAALSPIDQQVEVMRYGFIPARIEQLSDPTLVVNVPIQLDLKEPDFPQLAQKQPRNVQMLQLQADAPQILASLLTAMFLHGGWMHVLGNMWFLWIFGDNIEERLGSLLYLGFYLVGGLLATACHWAYDPHSTLPVVGASGAVAAVLGGYAVTFPKSNVRTLIFFGFITVVNIPALVWLGLWFGGQLFEAAIHRDLGVAVWAHIGGFVTGAVLMPILSFGAPPPGSAWREEVERHFTFAPPER